MPKKTQKNIAAVSPTAGTMSPNAKVMKGVKDQNVVKKKRAKNAFMYFSQENRSQVKAEYELKSIVDVAKKLGERWRELTDEGKAPYVKMSADEAERLKSES